MAGSLAWHAAFFAAALLGSVMDEVASGFADMTWVWTRTGQSSLSPSGLDMLQILRNAVVIGYGILYDFKGPRISLLVGSAGFAGMCLSGRLFGIHSLVPQVLRALAHPSFGLIALGAGACSHEERPALFSRLIAVRSLGSILYHTNSWWIFTYGYSIIFVWMCLPLAALHIYLTRSCSPGVPRQDADISPLPTPSGVKVSATPGTVLLRPEVLSAFIGIQIMSCLRIEKFHALGLAAADEQEKHLLLGGFQFTLFLSSGIIILTWSHLPAMVVRRFGPQSVLQGLLEALALVDFLAMLLFYAQPQDSLLHALKTSLQFSLVASMVIQAAVITVSHVFVVGVVEAGERGTATSLLQVGDDGRHFPIPVHAFTTWLYHAGGISTTLAFCSVASLGLLLLFRRSPLLHFHLKEG